MIAEETNCVCLKMYKDLMRAVEHVIAINQFLSKQFPVALENFKQNL